MSPAREVGKWKGGREVVENFYLFNYICYDLHAVNILCILYIITLKYLLVLQATASCRILQQLL